MLTKKWSVIQLLRAAIVLGSATALGCVSSGGASAGSEQGDAGSSGALTGSTAGAGFDGDPSHNRLVVTSKDVEIVAVDPNSATHERVYSFEKLVNVTSLAIESDVVYAGAQDNSVNAIDLRTKKLLWDVPLGRYEQTTLAHPRITLEGGFAYAAGVPGVLYAIELSTGQTKWTYPLNPSGAMDGYFSLHGAPTVTADRVFIGTREPETSPNAVHAIDTKTGKRVWQRALPRGVTGGLTVAGDTLLVPAGNLFALDRSTGKVRWELEMERLSRGAGTPSVSGDLVIFQGALGVTEGRLFCVQLSNGEVVWSKPVGNAYAGIYAPHIVGDYVFAVFEKGGAHLYGNGRAMLMRLSSGEVIWRNENVSVETSPVFSNGRLFFHGHDLAAKGKVDERVGLLSLDATTGGIVWLNNYFRFSKSTTPIVLGDDGG